MPAAHIEERDQDECRRLLATRHLGRLAIPDFGGPVIFPVNYILGQDLVIFRTDPGSKLDAATEREQVAFEVDAVEEATRTGWSWLCVAALADAYLDFSSAGRLEWAPRLGLGMERRLLRTRP